MLATLSGVCRKGILKEEPEPAFLLAVRAWKNYQSQNVDPQVGFMSKICANSRHATDSHLNTDLWHHEHLTGGLRAASGRHDGVAFIPDDGGSQEAAMAAVESTPTPEHPMVLFCNRAPFPQLLTEGYGEGMGQVQLLSLKQKVHTHMNWAWSLKSLEPVLQGSERKGSSLHPTCRMDSQ